MMEKFMDMCPNDCGQPLVQHNANEYYCKKCKAWFDLDDVINKNTKTHIQLCTCIPPLAGLDSMGRCEFCGCKRD
jgi:hypothetical protein